MPSNHEPNPIILAFVMIVLAAAAVCSAATATTTTLRAPATTHARYLPVARTAPTPPAIAWDTRLTEVLNLTWEPAHDCSAGCWQLTRAYTIDPDEHGGGLHHIMAKTVAEGEQRGGVTWYVTNSGVDSFTSKPPPDWADYPMYAGSNYSPALGEQGPHTVWVGARATSDAVVGIGLPERHHWPVFLVYTWYAP